MTRPYKLLKAGQKGVLEPKIKPVKHRITVKKMGQIWIPPAQPKNSCLPAEVDKSKKNSKTPYNSNINGSDMDTPARPKKFMFTCTG